MFLKSNLALTSANRIGEQAVPALSENVGRVMGADTKWPRTGRIVRAIWGEGRIFALGLARHVTGAALPVFGGLLAC
jgi:hypothetical protein